jgi:hypothetical protein
VPLTYRDNMVGALATDRSDQPFGEAVLPGRAWRNGFVTDAHSPQSASDGGTVGLVAIPDQVTRSLIPRECLRNLACKPFCRRVRCDVDPNQVSTIQADDNEGIEQIEADGRDDEQIHGRNVRRVVSQKGAPSRLGGPHRLTMYLATLDCATSNPSLSSSPWMRGAPHSGLSTLIRRISARRSALICGRPPRDRDFQRQYWRKPARCQRTRVSGRMIVIVLRIDRNHRYS